MPQNLNFRSTYSSHSDFNQSLVKLQSVSLWAAEHSNTTPKLDIERRRKDVEKVWKRLKCPSLCVENCNFHDSIFNSHSYRPKVLVLRLNIMERLIKTWLSDNKFPNRFDLHAIRCGYLWHWMRGVPCVISPVCWETCVIKLAWQVGWSHDEGPLLWLHCSESEHHAIVVGKGIGMSRPQKSPGQYLL